MEKVYKIANLYVATLRQMYLIHQHNHWNTRGEAFYSNHLIFERLYKSAAEDADIAAEKMIGLFGAMGVEYSEQAKFMFEIANKYAHLSTENVEMSLAIEKDFLQLSKDAYKAFDNEGVLTFGLDDMIMGIANKREESCYLLQQILDK